MNPTDLHAGRRRAAVLAFALVALTFAPPARADEGDRIEDLLDQDRLHEALAAAEAFVKREPDSAQAQGLYGRALFEFDRFGPAREALARSAELSPDIWGPWAHAFLARIAAYYGEDEACREHLAQVEDDHWVKVSLSALLAPEGYARRDTEHYVVYSDPDVTRAGGDVLGSKLLELIYEGYSKVFPFEVDPKRKHRVYLFSSYERFDAMCRAMGRDGGNGMAGYFYSEEGALLVRTRASEPGARGGFTGQGIRTLFHEAFHQFIRMHARNIPDWFNEGLAMYFETARQAGPRKLAIGGLHPNRVDQLRRALDGRARPGLLSLRELLTLSYDDFHDKSRESLNYSHAWGFVHFLLDGMGKKGRKLVRDYFKVLNAGRPAAEAHAETFGDLDLARLELAWAEYVKRLN